MTGGSKQFDLGRFLEAQETSYAQALKEIRRGAKATHWMWFIFPQVRGLGSSERSVYYGIVSRAEAAAYLAHPVLGTRLRECIAALDGIAELSAEEIFGPLDAMKLRSSLTLFEAAAADPTVFAAALEHYFAGTRDPKTLELLGGTPGR